MASNSSSVALEKYCEFCGAPAKRLFGKYLATYCSFSCFSISARRWTLLGTFILLPIGVFAIILLLWELSFQYIIQSIFIIFFLLLPGIVTLLISTVGHIKYNKRKELISEKFARFKNEIVQNNILHEQYSGPMIFTPHSGSAICPICKLKLYKQEEYYQCTICKAVFHTKHIMDWLTIKNECPICKNKYI